MKFLPPERFNKNSKKSYHGTERTGRVDGRVFKRDPRSHAVVFRLGREEQALEREREFGSKKVAVIQAELNSEKKKRITLENDVEKLKKMVSDLINSAGKGSTKRKS